jgi:hypothetical protein
LEDVGRQRPHIKRNCLPMFSFVITLLHYQTTECYNVRCGIRMKKVSHTPPSRANNNHNNNNDGGDDYNDPSRDNYSITRIKQQL